MQNINTILQNDETKKSVTLTLPLLWKLYSAPSFILTCLAVTVTTFALYRTFMSTMRCCDQASHLVTTALLYCCLLPVDVTVTQVILSCTFGLIFGLFIFGGRRNSFTSPVLLGIAFIFYTYDMPSQLPFSSYVLLPYLLVLPVSLLLFAAGALEATVAVSLIVVLVGISLVTKIAYQPADIFVIICLAYCFCDATVCPQSTVGRILYGVFGAGILYLLYPASELLDTVVFVCLFGTILTPLIDCTVENTLERRKYEKA